MSYFYDVCDVMYFAITCASLSAAIGPGCQELVSTDHVTFDHFMVGQELYVNATCREGYVIPRREGLAGRGGGSDVGEGEGVVTRKTLRCRGSFWDEVVTDCVGEWMSMESGRYFGIGGILSN